MSAEQIDRPKWLDFLSEEDLAFIKRFVLASGSLKEVAGIYGITYPTVRLRLDRLIEKIRVVDTHKSTSDFERLVRSLFADGKVDVNTLKTVLTAHKKEMEAQNEKNDRSS